MIKAVYFDFNGVIIDDEPLQMKAYQDVLRNHEIALTEEWYLDALGMNDRAFVAYAFQRANKSLSAAQHEEILRAKTKLHRTMIEEVLPIFPGVVNFLKAIAHDYSLGLVSMANEEEVNYVLDRARLRSLFSTVITAGHVSACKPAPDCYEAALANLNEHRQRERLLPLVPAECLAIEDSPPGIQSALSAGMHTLGVTNTVSADKLRAAGAEVVTHGLADWTAPSIALLYDR